MILPKRDIVSIVEQISELWLDLRGQRLFISGATGFVGTWLLESFINANERFVLGATAVVLTRNRALFEEKLPHLAFHPSVEIIEGDITTFSFPTGSFTHIIHAATETSHSLIDRDPIQAYDKIVSGMKRMGDFAIHTGARKFLLISSGAVYGIQPPDVTHVSETFSGGPDLYSPHAVYAEGKRVAEMIGGIIANKYGFELKIARCFTFLGPNMPLDKHFAIGNFMRDMLVGGPIHITGDGSPYRSYLHAIDMAVWLWMILFRGVNCRPYNVGSDVDMPLIECARILADQLPVKRDVMVHGVIDSSNHPSRYVPNIDRARKELALTVSVTFNDALQRTLNALKLKS